MLKIDWSSPRFPSYIPLIFLLVSLCVIYLRTLSPGLTWANDGSDGGDLIAAAATGGIAHPTGYPLYLLLARLFQLLPFGSLAFRTNLLSAILMALASGLVYLLVRDSSLSRTETNEWPAALVAGFAFGAAPLVWSQAVITEVYGLQAFLLALILYLYTSTRPIFVQTPLDSWRGLALGLGVSNHVTAVLLIPAALAIGSLQRRSDETPPAPSAWFENLRWNRGALWRQLAAFGLGLCLYLILPVRALANPPVNWGNPITPGRFWWLASGELYQNYYLGFRLAELWERLQAWAFLLLQQWGVIGLALALLGLVYFFVPSRLVLLTIWQALVYSGFAMFYASADSYVYLLPVCISFSIWIGLGLARLMDAKVVRASKLGWVVSFLFLAYLVGSALYHWPQVDASHDLRAEDFGRQVLASAPPNALVFAEGDQAVFAVWYFHFALHQRPDLVVIATDLLHFDWYQETLRLTYPSLVVAEPFPWPTTLVSANPSRANCYVRYSDVSEINCFPPGRSP